LKVSIPSIKHDWHEFYLLTREERWLLFQASVFLPVIGTGLHFMNFQRLREMLEPFLPVPVDDTGEDASDRAATTARLVQAAAGRMPFAMTCLVRSTTLWWLLGRQGIDSVIRLGVNRDNGEFHAHAWVEFDNKVLNDRDDIHDRFAAFETITLQNGAEKV
jgi:hypothetical protein